MTVQTWFVDQTVRQCNTVISKSHQILCMKNFIMVRYVLKKINYFNILIIISELWCIVIKARKRISSFKILVYQSSNNCYRRSIVNEFSTQAAQWTIGTWYSLNRTAIAWPNATCTGKGSRRFCPCRRSRAEKPLALWVLSSLCFLDICLSV